MWKRYNILLIILVIILFISWWLFGPRYVNKTVDIYGLDREKAIKLLSKDGIVNRYALELLLKITNKHIEYGEYRFRGFVSVFGVYEKLTHGEFLTYKITIPEGFDIYEIAERLQRYQICSKQDFIKYATDSRFAKKQGLDSVSFEGYLFPDTYFLYKHENPKNIIKEMYMTFKQNMEKYHLKPTKDDIIIASIVEKEAKFMQDKPKVASVIYNRLKKGMKLQMDSTVIYALKVEGKWNGVLNRKDFFIRSPYNTYVVKGLPPTPICNPGIKSIESAMNPANTDYLYFVANKFGRLFFNKNLENHQKMVISLKYER